MGGLVAVLAGVLGYFAAVVWLGARLPSVRDHAIPNWIVVAVGLVLAAAAVVRSAPGRRRLPGLLLAVDLALATLFVVFLYPMSTVPEATGPTRGTAAPDFALRDQTGATRTLASFRGAPLLLVFYRGHW